MLLKKLLNEKMITMNNNFDPYILFKQVKEINPISTYKKTNSINILDKFENKKSISLICGQVQSGKTNQIIDIIFTAFEKFDYDCVFFLCGTTNSLKEQSEKRIRETNNHKFIIKNVNEIILISRKILVPLLKQKNSLEKMNSTIVDNPNKKILIIDDECDFATINNKNENYSEINRLITKSYDFIDNGGLILVTATPYANILNTRTKLNVDWIFTMQAPNSYTGINYFNNLENFYYTNDFYINEDFNNWENELAESLCVWLWQTYLFFKEKNDEKSTFLIYTSDKLDEHKKYYNQVIDWLNSLHQYDIRQWYKKNKFDENKFNDFIKWIGDNKKEIKSNTCIFNSENDENNDITKINNSKFSIVIGGVFLSRGITYENLLVELFTYCPENNINCDTLLQRCRWFGYRKMFRDGSINIRSKYMRLVTKNPIVNAFNEIEKYNNLIFDNSGYELNINNLKIELNKLQNNLNVKATNDRKQ